MNDSLWLSVLQLVASHAGRRVVVPPLPAFRRFKQKSYSEFDVSNPEARFDLFVLHKDLAPLFPEEFVIRLCDEHPLVFGNEVFLVFGPRKSKWSNRLQDRLVSSRPENRLFRHVQPVVRNAEKRQLASQNDELLVFLHINKCAGTSVFSQLKQHYPRSIYLVGGNPSLRSLRRPLDAYSLIGGHFTRSAVLKRSSSRPIRWLIILRDPVKRFLSELAHNRRTTQQFIGKTLNRYRTEELQSVLKSKTGEIKRFIMLHYLSRKHLGKRDSPEVDKSLNEVESFISRDDVTFGFQEDMSDYYRIVNHALGIELEPSVRLNTAPNYDSITPDERAFVSDQCEQLFRYDLRLYRAAREIYQDKYQAILNPGSAPDSSKSQPETNYLRAA